MKKCTTVKILLPGLLLLQACAGPASLQIASQIASVATIAMTGKGVGDHMLSVATDSDCAFFNLLHYENLCSYSNSAEMLLLTNNQNIDDHLLVYKEIKGYRAYDGIIKVNRQKTYLVLGSFSSHGSARTYQAYHPQWQTSIYQAGPNSGFRIIMGPVVHDNVDRLKSSLKLAGINDAWSITL